MHGIVFSLSYNLMLKIAELCLLTHSALQIEWNRVEFHFLHKMWVLAHQTTHKGGVQKKRKKNLGIFLSSPDPPTHPPT